MPSLGLVPCAEGFCAASERAYHCTAANSYADSEQGVEEIVQNRVNDLLRYGLFPGHAEVGGNLLRNLDAEGVGKDVPGAIALICYGDGGLQHRSGATVNV